MKILNDMRSLTGSGFVAALLLAQIAITPMAQAQESDDQLSRLLACRGIGEAQGRLACFDKASEALETATKSGDLVTITKADVQGIQEDGFGFNLPSLPKLSSIFGISKSGDDGLAKEQKRADKNAKKAEREAKTGISRDGEGRINKAIVPIVSLQVFGRGKTRFYLENGQVWEQTNGPDLGLKIRKNRPLAAHILRGALSGFRMRVNGKGRMVNVRRIK